jgi:tRNA-specific 2-thiouridylase
VEAVNWIAAGEPRESMRAMVRIRHKHVPAPATVKPLDGQLARVTFDVAQRAITSGQGAIFYDLDGERVLGGGWIR